MIKKITMSYISKKLLSLPFFKVQSAIDGRLFDEAGSPRFADTGGAPMFSPNTQKSVQLLHHHKSPGMPSRVSGRVRFNSGRVAKSLFCDTDAGEGQSTTYDHHATAGGGQGLVIMARATERSSKRRRPNPEDGRGSAPSAIAIKVGKDPEDVKTEAMVLSLLKEKGLHDHPHLVRFLGRGKFDGLPALVLKQSDYGALSSIKDGFGVLFQKNESIATIIAADIIYQLTKILSAMAKPGKGAHKQSSRKRLRPKAVQLVHADIKENNILICTGGKCKLVDFGLAGPRGHQMPGRIGTWPYMAPEVLRIGKPKVVCGPFLPGAAPYTHTTEFQPSIDIFALGVMLSRLLTGYFYFETPHGTSVDSADKLLEYTQACGAYLLGPYLVSAADTPSTSLLFLANQMLSPNPIDRPGYDDIQRSLFEIIRQQFKADPTLSLAEVESIKEALFASGFNPGSAV